MDLRNSRGAITPAEGCIFGAVGLFVVLLMALLYIAFLRFQEPPGGQTRMPAVGLQSSPVRSLPSLPVGARWNRQPTDAGSEEVARV